jgi:hypothetical protein
MADASTLPPDVRRSFERLRHRGDFPWAVVEAVDPEAVGVDPLAFM